MTDAISFTFRHLVVDGKAKKPSSDIAEYSINDVRTEIYSLTGSQFIYVDFSIKIQIRFIDPVKVTQPMWEMIIQFQQDPYIRNVSCTRDENLITISGTLLNILETA